MMQTTESRAAKDYILFQVNGEDASSFLQGQLTADINNLGENWQYAGYCNPKGRLLALFMIWKMADSFYLLFPTELAESIGKRLQMYVMRSKVVIEQQDNIHCHAIIDINALNQIANIQHTNKTFSNGKNCYHHQNDNNSQTILAFGDHYLLLTSDSVKRERTNNALWREKHLVNGCPQVYSKSSEQFIPQMLNLDKSNGISFDKGCYTGQEIIARMHYLGNVKQRMFVLHGDHSNETLEIADKIFADSNNEKNIGQIVDFTTHNGKATILAVLRLEALNAEAFYCNGSTFKLIEKQPYDFST